MFKSGDKIIIRAQSDEIHIETLSTGKIIIFYDLDDSLSAQEVGINFRKNLLLRMHIF